MQLLRIRSVIALFLILAVSVATGHARPMGQIPELRPAVDITADERFEAKRIAETFRARFLETGDVGPILVELGSTDLVARLLQDPGGFGASIPDEELNLLTEDEFRRYYVATLNAWGLTAIYVASRHSLDDEELDVASGELFPPGVIAHVKRDEAIRALLLDGETHDDLRTAAGIRRVLPRLERIVAMMQEHFRRNPVAESELFRKNEKVLTRVMEGTSGDVSSDLDLWIVKGERGGLPDGTRLFCTNVLLFHVEMAATGRRLEIVAVGLPD